MRNDGASRSFIGRGKSGCRIPRPPSGQRSSTRSLPDDRHGGGVATLRLPPVRSSSRRPSGRPCASPTPRTRPPETPPTLREAIRMTAKMGGSLGARGRGNPRPKGSGRGPGYRENCRILGNSWTDAPGRSRISCAQRRRYG